MSNPPPDRCPFVTFEEAELNHLRDSLDWSLSQTLRWLDGAHRFGVGMQRRNRAAGLPYDRRFDDEFAAEERLRVKNGRPR